MRPHLPDEELHAYADGALSSAQRAEISEHLLACLVCRAALGEVEALRAQVTLLLASAAPRAIHRPPLPAPATARRGRRRAAPAAAAAALLLAGASSWVAWQSPPGTAPGTPSLATVAVAPAVLANAAARLVASADSSLGTPLEEPGRSPALRARTLTLASRAAMPPRIVTPMMPVTNPAARPRPAVDPLAAVNPAEGWEATSWAAARTATRGAVAHVSGLPVSAVRLRPSTLGGRPTVMVRQTLRDGRALWVVEGAQEDLEGLTRLLAASGLAMSTPQRARPDYVGTDDAPVRTIRMVALAAYLPVDSLNAIAGERLRLE